MPNFKVTLPSGQAYTINAPAGTTKEDALAFLERKLNPQPEASDEPPEPGKEIGGFWDALKDTATTIPRYGLEALAYQKTLSEGKENIEQRDALIKASEPDYAGVGFGEGNNWAAFKQLAGGSIGSFVAPAVAATATAFTPAAPTAPYVGFATNAAQYDAQNMARLAQERQAAEAEGRQGPAYDPMAVIGGSAAEAVLDVPELFVFNKLTRSMPLVKNLLRGEPEATSALIRAAKDGNATVAGGIFKGMVKGVAFEVPQELAQTVLERNAAGLITDYRDPEALEEYKQAALGAAILGPLAGGIEGALPNRKAATPPGTRATTPPPPAPPGTTTTTPPPPPPPPPGTTTTAPPVTPNPYGIPEDLYNGVKQFVSGRRFIAPQDLVERFGVSQDEAYTLLDALEEEGMLGPRETEGNYAGGHDVIQRPVTPEAVSPTTESAGPAGPDVTPTPNVTLPDGMQDGIDQANAANDEAEREAAEQQAAYEEWQRQQAEKESSQPQQLPTTAAPTPPKNAAGSPISGYDASYHLAQMAEQEGVDLTKLTRPQYVEYAVRHGVILEDTQLRMPGIMRTARSISEIMNISKELGAKYKLNSKESREFANWADNLPTTDPNKIGIRASSANKNSNSWFHFHVNNSTDATKGVAHKGYLGFDNVAQSLTVDNFKKFMLALRDAGYNGQVKTVQDTLNNQYVGDQVVFHGATEQDVELAHQIANQVWGDQITFRDRGFDVNKESYSQWLAKENQRLVVANFKNQQIRERLYGQGNGSQQRNQSVPSGQPNAPGSGTRNEVPSQGGTATGAGQDSQQAGTEGLDGDNGAAGKPNEGAPRKRVTLTKEEREEHNRLVLAAYNNAGGKITRTEMREATGLSDAHIDAARARLKTAGTPIKLAYAKLTQEQKDQLKQERTENQQDFAARTEELNKVNDNAFNEGRDEDDFDQEGMEAAQIRLEEELGERPEAPQDDTEARADEDYGRRTSYRRGPKVAGMSKDKVEGIVAQAIAGWKKAPKVTVVKTVNDLPAGLQARGILPDATGIYTDNEIFIISDNAESEAGVRATVFHEALGHAGIRAKYGKALRAAMLDIYKNHAGIRKAVETWLANNSGTYAGMSKDDQVASAMEELFAEHAELGPEKKNIWIAQAFNKIASIIREFLRSIGIVKGYTVNDIMEIIRQSHDIIIEGKAARKSGATGDVRYQVPTKVSKLNDFGPFVAVKPGGSNPGGIHEDSNGQRWILKGNKSFDDGNVTLEQSNDRAKNEVLANSLLMLANVPATQMKLVNLESSYHNNLSLNVLGVAGEWVDGLEKFNPNNVYHINEARKSFAANAWLANYDALGMFYDNVMVKNGVVYHIDPGGALFFRAQGLPKDAKYGVGPDGMLDPTAPEFESMRNTNAQQKKVYGGMTNDELKSSAADLSFITDNDIKDLVAKQGQGTPEFKQKLAENLIARRDAILQKVGLAPVNAPVAKAKVTKHFQTDDSGKSVIINDPTKDTFVETLNKFVTNPDTAITFAARTDTGGILGTVKLKNLGELNGIDFNNNKVDDYDLYDLTNDTDYEPPFIPSSSKTVSAGVIIIEPDGRIWVASPTNEFGGYKNTFPKGNVEGFNYSNSKLQETAIREAFEETGLVVEIKGFFGDIDRSTSRTRYYIAERVGGNPYQMGWESQAVKLAAPDDLAILCNVATDKALVTRLKALGYFKGVPPLPAYANDPYVNKYAAKPPVAAPAPAPAPAPAAAAPAGLTLSPQEQKALDSWKNTQEYNKTKVIYLSTHTQEEWENFEKKVAKAFGIYGLGTKNTYGKMVGQNSSNGGRYTTGYADGIVDFMLATENTTDPNILANQANANLLGPDLLHTKLIEAVVTNFGLSVPAPALTKNQQLLQKIMKPAAFNRLINGMKAAAPAVDPLALDATEQDVLDRWKKTKEYKDLRTTYVSNKGTPAWENFERKVAKVLAAVSGLTGSIGYSGATNRYTTYQTDEIVNFVDAIEKGKTVDQSANDNLGSVRPVAKQKAIIAITNITTPTPTPTPTSAPAVDPLALDAKEQDYLDRYKKTQEYNKHKSYWAPSQWADIERKIAKVAAITELNSVGYTTGGTRYTTANLDDLYGFVVAAETNDADSSLLSSYSATKSKINKAVTLLNTLNGRNTPTPNTVPGTNNSQNYNAEGIPFNMSDPWSRDNTAIVLNHVYNWQKAEQLIRDRVAQLNETGTEPFQKYFSASKVRDKNGEPLLAFRCTGHEITSYDGATRYTHIKVIFASPDAGVASGFASNGPHPRMYGLWINMTNPFDHRIKRHVEALMKHLKDTNYFATSSNSEAYSRSEIERGSWSFLEKAVPLEWIAKHHDGMIMKEGGELTYGILGDPTRRTEEGFRASDQIKSATGNDGSFGLYTGDIRYQRVRQDGSVTQIDTVIDHLPTASKKLMEAVKNALSKLPDALFRTYLGLLSIPHIADLYGKTGQLPSLNDLNRILEERAASMMERARPINANIRKWFKIANLHTDDLPRFYDIAMRTTINQIDVLDPAMANNPLTQEFNSLPAELQQIYRELREEYKHYSDQLIQHIVDNAPTSQAAAIRAEYESKRLKVYLPLVRNGEYWLTYQDEANETVVRAFDSPRERDLAVEALEGTGARDFEKYSRLSQIWSKEQPPSGFAAEVVKKMRASGASTEMIDAVYSTLLDYMPANSVRQIFRNNPDRGVLGYEPDVFQAYANMAKRMANQLNNIQYAKPLDTILSNIRAEAGGNRASSQFKSVVDNIEKQVAFLRNPTNGDLVNNLSYFSYFWHIAGNISSALINTTQMPIVVMPLLAGKYTWPKATAALKKATQMYMNGGRDDSGSEFLPDYTFYKEDMDEEYKQLFDFAVSRSAIRRPTGYEVTEARNTRVEDYTGLAAKVKHGLGFMFQNTERFNREVTLLAAYDLAKSEGMTEAQAREEALKFVTFAHGTALAETGPRLFQTGLGKVAFTFKRFAQSQIYMLAKLFHTAFKGEDPLVRKIAQRQLLGIYGASFAFAGVQGMPLYGAANLLAKLIAAMFGDDDEPFDMDETVRGAIGDLGYKGPINQLLNVDIASRTGFNGLVWRDDPRRLAEVGPALYMMENAFGPAYGAFRNIGEGVGKFAEGDYERGLESMTPSFIRNGMKGMRFAMEGATNKDGVPIVEDVNAYNSFMQILGLTPADLSEARARAGSMKAAEKKIIDRRTALLDRAYAARVEGDMDGYAEALDAIAEYNSKHREKGIAITPDTLSRSYKAKQAKERSAVDGVYLNKNLAPYLEDEYGD